MELSILILTIDEKENLMRLLPDIRSVIEPLTSNYEILIVDGGSTDGTADVAHNLGATVIQQAHNGYGNALRQGFAAAKGDYILTLDADLSHKPVYLRQMWLERHAAEVLIASRYIPGGSADMPGDRLWLSRILNTIFRTVLALPIQDMSSGYRLYQTRVLRSISLQGSTFDILPEILVKALADGWRVKEIPFHFAPRQSGGSKARLLRFGIAYAKTLHNMWRFRNSIESADYDFRAFDSRIFFQRFWQRRRHRIITQWAPTGSRSLDIGCGSSHILIDIKNIVGVDIRQNKLRYMRRFDKELVNGDGFTLPFSTGSFDCVICSEVIEHVPFEEQIFTEFNRVLHKGGVLILGTPDYDAWQWIMIENIYKYVIPGGYADEHITHYTVRSLKEILHRYGFRVDKIASILHAEVILRCEKL